MSLDNGPPEECFVYALIDPRDGQIKYIGQSSRGMYRPYQHWKHSHSPRIRLWVWELKKLGLEYEIKVLEKVRASSDLDEAENRWIRDTIKNGVALLNGEALRRNPPPRRHPSSRSISWEEAIRSRTDPEFAKELEPKPRLTLLERMKASRKDR